MARRIKGLLGGCVSTRLSTLLGQFFAVERVSLIDLRSSDADASSVCDLRADCCGLRNGDMGRWWRRAGFGSVRSRLCRRRRIDPRVFPASFAGGGILVDPGMEVDYGTYRFPVTGFASAYG